MKDRTSDLQNPFGWESLKMFGSNKLFQSSYFWLFFVPVIARLLKNIPETITVPIWAEKLTIPLTLPFSWKIFFFSSIFFSLASFIYSLRCPAIIKNYRTLDDFKAEGRTARQVVGMYRKCLYSRRYSPDLIDEITSSFERKHCNSNLLKHVAHDSWEKYFPDLFHAARDRVDCFSPKLRGVCAGCYFVGFILLGLVAGQNIMFVINAI